MRYGILGTTLAHHDDGTPVPLGGARLRALLAALALREGRPVPAAVLVGEVWDGDPPQDGTGALQTLVGRLRRSLGRDAVGSGPEGYRLRAGADEVDLGRFRRLAAEGERALAAGRAGEAAGLLREALDLWRGPALADLPDREAPAARCEAQRLAALRARIAADLALGRTAPLVPELAGLVRDHPLDEPLHALRIRALRAEGRAAEALQAYEEARRALADGLGADPGPELRALHRELLAPPPAGDPAPVEDPPSAGYLAPAEDPARTPAPPAPPAASAPARPPGNLRSGLTSFVGREDELRGLAAALSSARLVTLTGPGGSGKTRLSLEAARAQQAAGAWPDGVWLAELAPLDDPEAVPGAVLAALGLRETVLHHGKVADALEARSADPVRRLVEHCAGRRMLLLLDNCEHLVGASAGLADRLLAECPGVAVLATSREPLGVPGEAVRPLDPLPEREALRLLAERGAAARPGFDPAEDPAAAAEVCRRLDGLPLALELAAARLRGMTLRQIADRLDRRFRLLDGGSRTLLPRQQTLRAVVDWSWDLLGDGERAVLRRLSVFAGGCTLEAAEQVCADGADLAEEDVAGLLLSLVDRSLVVADLDGGDGGARYRLLETVHAYAAERLREAGDAELHRARQRHLRFFRELVRRTEPLLRGREQLRRLDLLEREKDDIRAALRRAVDAGEEQEALCLVLGMGWLWAVRNDRTEARAWCDAVAALGPDPLDADPYDADLHDADLHRADLHDAALHRAALHGAALHRAALHGAHPHGAGLRAAAAAAPAPLDLPPPWPPAVLREARRQAFLYRLVAGIEEDLAALSPEATAELGRRVLAAYPPELPRSARFPAQVRVFAALVAGDLDAVPAVLDAMVEGCRRHGGEWDQAFALQFRAKFANDRPGGPEQSLADAEEALRTFERLGDRWGLSEALSALAEAAARRGDAALASDGYARALGLARELGARHDVPGLLVRRGEALFGSDPGEAERLVREGVREALALGRDGAGTAFFGELLLLMLAVRRGDRDGADALVGRLAQGLSQVGFPGQDVFRGIHDAAHGWSEARFGRPRRGVALVRDGVRRMRGASGPARWFADLMAVVLLSMAACALARLAVHPAEPEQDRREAARRGAALLGAYAALGRKHPGNHLARQEVADHERLLRGVLGDAGYEAAHAEGGGLDIAGAAALLEPWGGEAG
ncbi:winged helix-turn-helix domain-containing protein [Streptacidiphilus sp. ASG 303]|uniref:AfsR/SARP family transcriptional regulator n=1 Tax=Streptacidiphilus sp. ASG 303 TaxID=2896847 RepID=UPI001E5B0961|nr:BTAD domain-containing putative transcriptional regulator [Streptacidiphilus sp. ASG 303]MCD0485054.1 winged helix-turn-helix domain-containing protein [Streptacidiphilus sp. ASG 303]